MRILRTVVIGIVLTSCCMGTDECLHDDYLYFRIFSMTGEELFTGASPKYTVDELKLYTVDNGTRVDITSIMIEPDRLWTFVGNRHERLIVEVQGQPKDTVDIRYDVINDKCCDKQSRIKTTTVDGEESDYNYQDGIDIRIVD